ncbi:hypothetical protein LSTR_LSTR013652 [Laodelphax striatellus]|uniref:VWFC domain-containing protein n=1 Tax=Laodelphax striatellus TaxID=195883 RepID=A0A482WLI0_LAOST|nr:hypothetical protein LSTR_LSTR013652 [Laodelphax striatellus]
MRQVETFFSEYKADGAVNENSILEGRSRNGNPVLSQNGPGCVHNGTVYAEGSAMSTSSLCEYCYCIKGQQHCVKPQCVLAMPGCQPVFTKHSCCPIKYNCTILNSTKNKEQSEDYDYDYNESSLPPSLPNLRIIPFVAADAVVAKTDSSSGANYPHGPGKPLLPTQHRKPPYYKVNHHNRFSPPTETEGGFVPKEPPTLDHPLYDGKLEFPYHSVGFNIEITVPPPADQALPAPATNLEKMCMHNGKRYSYGDVVGEPQSCKLCMCYYGEIVCQEPKCTPPQTGCTRIHDPTVGCCGRIVCGTNDLDSPTRVIDHINTPPPPHAHAHYSSPTTNLPAFTIADIVVSTPDPFRDVIRTEPAPDLPSLIGEIIHLWDQTTQQYATSSLPSITTGSDEAENAVENRNTSSFGSRNGTGNENNGMGNGSSGIGNNANEIGINNNGIVNKYNGIGNNNDEMRNKSNGLENNESSKEEEEKKKMVWRKREKNSN